MTICSSACVRRHGPRRGRGPWLATPSSPACAGIICWRSEPASPRRHRKPTTSSSASGPCTTGPRTWASASPSIRHCESTRCRRARHPPWTYEEHDRYCARWPVGTMQRLAVDIALYSGVRVVDLHMLGPQHLRNGWLFWTEGKNKDTKALKSRSKGNKHREWKGHPAMLGSIAGTTHGVKHFIIRPDGQPYARPDRLGRAIVRWAKAAGVNKTAHGIRKLGARCWPTPAPTSSPSVISSGTRRSPRPRSTSGIATSAAPRCAPST